MVRNEKTPDDLGTELSRHEVRRRSLAGVFYLTSSSFGSLVTGFLASLALARMLEPRDFGVVAIGSTAVLIANVLADGGLGAGLIRRAEPPTRAELRTINGIQLLIASALCIPVATVALEFFGRSGAITATMVASLPIALMQTPGRVLLAREMRYDRQLAVDFGSQTSLQVFSVAAVALGAGVWGLAIGQVVKAVVGTGMVAAVTREVGLPSLRGWRTYGSLVRFGLGFQASWVTFVAREQGLNTTVGLVGGITPLGLWSFTNRIVQLPQVAFNSLYAVGFPAMSNLIARGEDASQVILRMTRRAAIAGVFVFPAFAAASPDLIPAVFGSQWRDSARIVPYICLSTMILGPIAISATSYLSAIGKPGTVARASASLGVVWIALSALLLPVIGVAGIGVANLCGALVEAAMLDRAVHRHAGVSPARPLLRVLPVGAVAGLTGWAFAITGPGGSVAGILSAGIAVVAGVAGLSIWCRDDLRDVVTLTGEILRSVVPRLRAASGVAAAPAPPETT